MQNKKLYLFLSLFLLISLTSCWVNKSEKINTSYDLENTSVQGFTNQELDTRDLEQDSSNNEDDVSKINISDAHVELNIIDSKCIWCNKCIIIASDNFVLDTAKLKAKVISQKNIYSSNVSKAIRHCPTNAIKIS